jgi:hypothetical protein
MEFRGVSDQDLKLGAAVSVTAYPSKQTRDELRADSLTVGSKSIDLR